MRSQLFNDNWQVTEKTANFGMTNGEEVVAVTLPHDAMAACGRDASSTSGNKKACYPNKTWEYTKKFHVDAEDRHKHICLQFEAVYRQAMVYINGDFAGQDSGGYSIFVVDADRFLRYGEENEITVVARTADDSRWYTGAGLCRDVLLLTGRLIHIAPFGVKITTPEITDGLAAVCVATEVHNRSEAAGATLQIETELLDADGNLVARDTAPLTVPRGESATQRQRLYLQNPRLWDVDSPALYTCRTRVIAKNGEVMDENTETFGVRSLALDPFNGLRLNGKTVKLRGSCIHHDGGPLGAATYLAAERRRVRILKEAGFNAVRMAHQPASLALLRACDEQGMLVMDEAFDMWTEPKCNFDYAIDFPTWWERDLTAMVAKDYNHPSVILYSIGNEIQDAGSANGAVWGRKLAEKLRALDPHRYITNSINGMVAAKLLNTMRLKMQENMQAALAGAGTDSRGKGEINSMMNALGDVMDQVMTMDEVGESTAEAYAEVDVAGYNYMDARYEMDREQFPNRIVCGSETYAPGIDRHWRLIMDNSHVIGDFCWTGWDYLGEAGIGKVNYNPDPRSSVYGEYPDLMSMTGDIDITGVRRPASYYREIVFGRRKAPYIAVQRPAYYGKPARLSSWSWSDSVASWSWDGHAGKPVKVEVYSDADEVELLLNGASLGRAKTGEGERFKAVFDTVYQPGELTAVAYTNGAETGRHSLRSAEGPARLLAEADRAELRADGTDLAYVAVGVADAEGTVYTCKNTDLTVEIEGPAVLAGFGSGDPSPVAEFYEATRPTFDGRALAIIRPTGAGPITVRLRGEGIAQAATVAIRAV